MGRDGFVGTNSTEATSFCIKDWKWQPKTPADCRFRERDVHGWCLHNFRCYLASGATCRGSNDENVWHYSENGLDFFSCRRAALFQFPPTLLQAPTTSQRLQSADHTETDAVVIIPGELAAFAALAARRNYGLWTKQHEGFWADASLPFTTNGPSRRGGRGTTIDPACAARAPSHFGTECGLYCSLIHHLLPNSPYRIRRPTSPQPRSKGLDQKGSWALAER